MLSDIPANMKNTHSSSYMDSVCHVFFWVKKKSHKVSISVSITKNVIAIVSNRKFRYRPSLVTVTKKSWHFCWQYSKRFFEFWLKKRRFWEKQSNNNNKQKLITQTRASSWQRNDVISVPHWGNITAAFIRPLCSCILICFEYTKQWNLEIFTFRRHYHPGLFGGAWLRSGLGWVSVFIITAGG